MHRLTQEESEALTRVVAVIKLIKQARDSIHDGRGNTYTSIALRTIAKTIEAWETGAAMRKDIQLLDTLAKGGDDSKPVPV